MWRPTSPVHCRAMLRRTWGQGVWAWMLSSGCHIIWLNLQENIHFAQIFTVRIMLPLCIHLVACYSCSPTSLITWATLQGPPCKWSGWTATDLVYLLEPHQRHSTSHHCSCKFIGEKCWLSNSISILIGHMHLPVCRLGSFDAPSSTASRVVVCQYRSSVYKSSRQVLCIPFHFCIVMCISTWVHGIVDLQEMCIRLQHGEIVQLGFISPIYVPKLKQIWNLTWALKLA